MARAAIRVMSAPVRARGPLPPLKMPPVPGPGTVSRPDGATTVRLAMAIRDWSALETRMVWAPRVVPTGMATVANTLPVASALGLTRFAGHPDYAA